MDPDHCVNTKKGCLRLALHCHCRMNVTVKACLYRRKCIMSDIITQQTSLEPEAALFSWQASVCRVLAQRGRQLLHLWSLIRNPNETPNRHVVFTVVPWIAGLHRHITHMFSKYIVGWESFHNL